MSSQSDSSDEEYKPKEQESDFSNEADTDYDSDGHKIHVKELGIQRNKRPKSQNDRPHKRLNSNKDESNNTNNAEIVKKKEEDSEDEKVKSNALWASFLNDTNTVPTKKDGMSAQECKYSPNYKDNERAKRDETQTLGLEKKKEFKIKETPTPNTSKATLSVKPRFRVGFGRSSSSGLAGALNQLAKKDKTSTLEKSKLDWMKYKKNEGIEEELQTHNKGKDGYLQRQDFLERTDLRQFEHERELRQSKRSNR